MKALIQRVSKASVENNNNVVGTINKGLLIFLGVEKGDTEKDIEYLAKKISYLRIFEDPNGKMNLSVLDIQGEALVISQFTLVAYCNRGNRPSFDNAENPQIANEIYIKFIEALKNIGVKTQSGEFRAYMQVHLTNEGPVTIMLETKQK